ncbi:glucose-methanol-choline oxidoreductase [Rhizorhabdus wittichii RW1]|uniref:Glucose-methanol-choline oxidoreductase n=1 Tax=Rhizorhabdus wittichii (strain DSM 6014 / CCUG 31198 / JCM 15750 / NBRC 105917 / EY 4224 / RW1) TaxID=392499 RepID=A0A9J9HFI3_RHIWR|nr:glucose-methanol-choline oxidoreductase [Rhizorhabdus wittichii RW1]
MDKGGSEGSYDYIVVGGGSSGCVTAGRLVREQGARVLLLEAGGDDDDPLIRMPAGTFKMMLGGSPHIKSYQSSPQPHLAGRIVPIPQGNVIGGGSSVNVMAYMRGCEEDYARWDAAIGGGWSWADMLPHFRRQEGNVRLDDESHGSDGPLKVSDPHYKVSATSYFLRTMQKRGLPFRHDFNAGELVGVGYLQTTMDGPRRCSAADAFLAPCRADPRLTIATNAVATRVRVEDGRAVGVEYRHKGRPCFAAATRQVILTAGALATPKLLMLSGIGDADHLRAHGIDPIVDLPGVGQNLQDHVVVRLTTATNGAFGYFGQDRGFRMIVNGLRYLLFKDGPVSSNGAECIGFASLDAPDGAADTQLYCLGIMWPSAYSGPVTHGVTLMASLTQPRSRGSVRLRSSDPFDDPIVDLNWLSEQADADLLVKGLRYLRQIAGSEPLASIIAEERAPGPLLQSDDDLERYVRETAESAYHPVGTCRAGKDGDPMAVLTPDLRVRGVDGLRVFDASMMPNIVSANTNAVVMAAADRGVDLMLGRAGQFRRGSPAPSPGAGP